MSLIDYLNEFLNSSLPFPFYLMEYPPLYGFVEAFWCAGFRVLAQVRGTRAPQRFAQTIYGRTFHQIKGERQG